MSLVREAPQCRGGDGRYLWPGPFLWNSRSATGSVTRSFIHSANIGCTSAKGQALFQVLGVQNQVLFSGEL